MIWVYVSGRKWVCELIVGCVLYTSVPLFFAGANIRFLDEFGFHCYDYLFGRRVRVLTGIYNRGCTVIIQDLRSQPTVGDLLRS